MTFHWQIILYVRLQLAYSSYVFCNDAENKKIMSFKLRVNDFNWDANRCGCDFSYPLFF